MKTNSQIQVSELKSRPEQLNTEKPRINFKRRKTNRSLNTEKLLALLRSEAPKFFELAEVVGQWVWIQFEQKQPNQVTRALSELGFHWNYARQTWQHPCGTIAEERATYDPRKRYGSRFPARVNAA